MKAFFPMLVAGLSFGASFGAAQPQRGRVSALFAEQAGGGVRLSWAVARGAEGSTLELSRDGSVIWKGVSDHFVDGAASPGAHVYRLSAAGSSREVKVVARGEACSGAARVTLDEPYVRWIALNSVAEVKISGSVTQPEGCGPAALSVRVLGPDAYERSGELEAPLKGGFQGVVYIDASQGPALTGTPGAYLRDVKEYLVEVKATNENGEAVSARRSVRVPMRPPRPAP